MRSRFCDYRMAHWPLFSNNNARMPVIPISSSPAFPPVVADIVGAIPVVVMFGVALFLVASLMAASIQKQSWVGAAVIGGLWMCAGFLVDVLLRVAPQVPMGDVNGDGGDLIWPVIAGVWGLTVVVCLLIALTMYQRGSERRHRAVQSSIRSRRRRRSGEGSAGHIKKDTYEV